MAADHPESGDVSDPPPGSGSDISRVRTGLLYQALTEAGFGDAHLARAKPEVWAPILAEITLFAGLDRPSLRRIAAVGQVARVSGGQVIVREGTSSQGLYVLLTGTATAQGSGGGQVTLRRGDCFGELGLLDAAPRTASVTADADLWVMKLPRRKFLELMETDPGIARRLSKTVASRRHRSEATVAPQREPTGGLGA